VAAAKKITRKELLKEPDEFLTLSSRFLGWAARHRREINYATSAVLALALLAAGYLYYANRQEAQAGALFGQALAKYDRLAADQPKAAREVSADFRRVINEYGGTSNGRMAALVYANLCYQAGDFAQAAELYKASLERFVDQPLIHFQILKSLGYTYEGLKEPAAALPYFERALASPTRGCRTTCCSRSGTSMRGSATRPRATRPSSACSPSSATPRMRTSCGSGWRADRRMHALTRFPVSPF